MKRFKLLQGDSFAMNLLLKDGETPIDIYEDEAVAVGFYNDCGNKYIAKYTGDSTTDGIIKGSGDGMYIVVVGSDITKDFVGNVDVEITVYNKLNPKEVSHADKIVGLYFETRRINNDI